MRPVEVVSPSYMTYDAGEDYTLTWHHSRLSLVCHVVVVAVAVVVSRTCGGGADTSVAGCRVKDHADAIALHYIAVAGEIPRCDSPISTRTHTYMRTDLSYVPY